MTRGSNGRFKKKFRMTIVHWGGVAGALVAICGLIALGNGYVIGCNETVKDANSFPILQKQLNDLSLKLFKDSISDAQRLDDLEDSVYDHRQAIEELQTFKTRNFIIGK